jgi:hypothetical protein
MVPGSDLAKIARLCTAIGNDLADESGFVPIRKLLFRFNAQLSIRPLLVEGMLASVGQNPSSPSTRSWAVLLDSDTYPFSMTDVEKEHQGQSLPNRMRNTIAHELVHSLAFRTSEFGLSLKTRIDKKESLQEFVKAIEQETECLSPLLLLSEKALKKLLQGKKETLSLSDLLGVVKDAGISRYVLISRLALIQRAGGSSDLLNSAGLRNLAVGIGVWADKGSYVKGWPVFWNFDEGIPPSFLLKLDGQQLVPAEHLFADESISMRGGQNHEMTIETDAGTRNVPKAMKMKVQISNELGPWKQGSEFLFSVRRVDSA